MNNENFPNRILEALQEKVKMHNARCASKITLSQLQKVYRRGVAAFAEFGKPGKACHRQQCPAATRASAAADRLV